MEHNKRSQRQRRGFFCSRYHLTCNSSSCCVVSSLKRLGILPLIWFQRLSQYQLRLNVIIY